LVVATAALELDPILSLVDLAGESTPVIKNGRPETGRHFCFAC